MTEKISKICWNDFGWTRPSGTNGKSPSSNSYENAQGYGHEEWLLDKSKIINNYHYGFLQPLNLKTDRHVGQTYRIWLYTITNKQKFLVGKIENAMCISKQESSETYKTYKQNGWIKEMVKDLEHAGINPTFLKETSSETFFNLKFKINDIKIFDDFPVISNDDVNLTTTRYKLLDKIADFDIDDIKQKGTDSYSRKAGVEVIVDPYHNKIQNTLTKLLKSSREYFSIEMEKDNVDVQANFKPTNKSHYFEIKTSTPKNNIRQAIGQLFEYSMFPDKQKAEKLIIVGDTEPTKEIKNYIKHLRDVTALNIYYRWVDIEKNKLSDEI
jgi:hypothetical protein